jgi:RNA polymerase sigma factor (sigma-70 family)
LDPVSEASAARDLISRCLSGDRGAAEQFQQTYGELIYGYPMRVYRTPREDAGDFYVFAFDRGRIFRRLRTFEGRAPLRAYLLGCVLDDLVLEWKRTDRQIETVSIDALGDVPDNGAHSHAAAEEDDVDRSLLSEILAEVEPSKAVVMKLLYAEDYDLDTGEIRYLAKLSGRSVPEVLDAVERLRATVREREVALKTVEDALDAVHAWIQLYERRLQRITADLSNLPPTAPAAERLRSECAQLEHKISRRHQQRTKLLARAQHRKVTAPYKDIAQVLNTSINNVASQILRLRRELARHAELRGRTLRFEEKKNGHDSL